MQARFLRISLVFALLFAVAPIAQADDSSAVTQGQTIVTYDFDTADSAKGWGRLATASDEAHQGGGAMKIVRRGWGYAPDKFEIDPEATYEVSVMIKAPVGQKPANILLSTRFYDENDHEFDPSSVEVIEGSHTTLVEDAKAGQDSILIAQAPDDATKPDAIMFHAKADLSDLPNHDLARIEVNREKRIRDITREANGYRVKLRAPLKKDYAAGTGVRAHRYQDYVCKKAPLTEQWTRCSFLIQGQALAGQPERYKFWHGARQIRLAIFLGVNTPGKEMEAFIDDVKLVKVTDAK